MGIASTEKLLAFCFQFKKTMYPNPNPSVSWMMVICKLKSERKRVRSNCGVVSEENKHERCACFN